MNDDSVDIGIEHSLQAGYEKPAYKTEEPNETLQISTHSEQSEKSQGSDSERYAIDETIKASVVQLCIFEKKAGKNEGNKVLSTERRDYFNKKALLMHTIHLGDCKEVCRRIVQKYLAECVFVKQMFRPATVSLEARYMSKI